MGLFFAFFGSLMIGGIIAVLFEKWGWSHHGLIPAMVIALGGVILVFMVRVMFNFSLGAPGFDAIAGAVGALILIPTEAAAKRRRNRR
ncbi:MAG: hypothetical protein AAGO57_01420 [Pseudomonadota bacterium]